MKRIRAERAKAPVPRRSRWRWEAVASEKAHPKK